MAKAKKAEAATKTVTKKQVTKAKVITPKGVTKKLIVKKRPTGKKAKLDNKNKKETVKQTVESQRDIKYKYPSDIDNQLDRKSWRQKTRNTDKQFKARLAKMAKTKDSDSSKEEIKYKRFRKEHFMVP
jgi:hypothetical protein